MPSRRATVLFLDLMLYFAASGADLGNLDCAGFIDLDILLTRIRHAQSKVYFLDAVKPTAEKAGASFMHARRGSL